MQEMFAGTRSAAMVLSVEKPLRLRETTHQTAVKTLLFIQMYRFCMVALHVGLDSISQKTYHLYVNQTVLYRHEQQTSNLDLQSGALLPRHDEG